MNVKNLLSSPGFVPIRLTRVFGCIVRVVSPIRETGSVAVTFKSAFRRLNDVVSQEKGQQEREKAQRVHLGGDCCQCACAERETKSIAM